MKFLHFDAPFRVLGTPIPKLLLSLATALSATSLFGTAQAQTPITVTVSSGARQTLKAVGASEPLGNTQVINDTNDNLRNEMMDLTFRDLKMKTVRLWANIGPRIDWFGNIDDPMKDATKTAETVAQFKRAYVDYGFMAAAKSRGVTTFLLGPSYPDYQTTVPPDVYAKRVANFIDILRKDGVQINATGLINEPRGGSWTPAMILLGVQTLKSELSRLGWNDVAIIAPENSNCDWTAVHNVEALKNDATTWSNLSGIATHSYGMAANNDMAALIAGASGASTKDYWITEVGAVNKFGDDDAGRSEPLSGPDAKQAAAYLSARFLNDMNHRVTHWIWFVAYGVKPSFNADGSANDTDGGQKLVNPSPDTQSVLIRPKYWVFKQLREVFSDGVVLRDSTSSLDGDMLWSYNKRPHVCVAAGKSPGGAWRIGVQNLTPVETAQGLNYPAAPYAVTLKIDELLGKTVQFTVKRSQPDGLSAATGGEMVTASNGQVTITVQPQELVTLRSAPAVGNIRFYPRSGNAARMTGGVFQGSNDDKIAGPWTTLASITSTPVDNAWTSLSTPTTTLPYRFLRYLSPDGSNGNVAEVEFLSNGSKVGGYPYGTIASGNYAYNTTFQQVFDASTSSYFDTGIANGSYAGLDLLTTPGTGNGVRGQYFSDVNYGTLVTTRTDPTISFNWGTDAPMTSVGPDYFSVRWTGSVQAVEAGDYFFRLVANNGATLYLNGSKAVSGSDSPYEWTMAAPINLDAGEKATLRYDFYEGDYIARAQLQWKRPGQTDYEIVPKSQLYLP